MARRDRHGCTGRDRETPVTRRYTDHPCHARAGHGHHRGARRRAGRRDDPRVPAAVTAAHRLELVPGDGAVPVRVDAGEHAPAGARAHLVAAQGAVAVGVVPRHHPVHPAFHAGLHPGQHLVTGENSVAVRVGGIEALPDPLRHFLGRDAAVPVGVQLVECRALVLHHLAVLTLVGAGDERLRGQDRRSERADPCRVSHVDVSWVCALSTNGAIGPVPATYNASGARFRRKAPDFPPATRDTATRCAADTFQ